MRASVRHHIEIDAPADAAWAVVTRADVLASWFPGLKACVMKEPTVRTVTTGMGISLDEQILTNDPLQRRFQYRITGGFFQEHLATIDVLPLGDERCLVSYASDADPATMAIVLGGVMAEALRNLRTQLEDGAGPALDAIAAPPPAFDTTEPTQEVAS
jgi:carbon monoxide dehydrogenase subunit G